ncbi:MAG: hypothetical protein KC593_20105 [Myxococcales bacterium]|nr:hypothetical protein [Myxococcales bacterium]
MMVLSEVLKQGPQDLEASRIDLLIRYYDAAGDADASARRVASDRFLLHKNDDLVDAHGVVERLNRLIPEVETIHLERIGGGEEGPLVLRCGEHLSAVTDDYEEELREGDIDLRSLELVETVSVRGLVGAVNGLLARTDFDRRFLMLVADGQREVYVAVPSAGALSLLHEHVLDHDSEEWLIDYCAF